MHSTGQAFSSSDLRSTPAAKSVQVGSSRPEVIPPEGIKPGQLELAGQDDRRQCQKSASIWVGFPAMFRWGQVRSNQCNELSLGKLLTDITPQDAISHLLFPEFL